MLRSSDDLEAKVIEIGFLPFFHNSVKGFSIQEMVDPRLWFSDEEGPWEWKGPVIRNMNCAYGKLFNGKAGYVSLEWLPDFANYRRAFRPVDSVVSDFPSGVTEKMILEAVRAHESLLSKELKDLCGLTVSRRRKTFDLIDAIEPVPAVKRNRRGGLEPALTRLQMSTRIVIADFEYSISRSGESYGWGIARYTTPEALYGDDFLSACEGRTPEESYDRIMTHLRSVFPAVTDRSLRKLID